MNRYIWNITGLAAALLLVTSQSVAQVPSATITGPIPADAAGSGSRQRHSQRLGD